MIQIGSFFFEHLFDLGLELSLLVFDFEFFLKLVIIVRWPVNYFIDVFLELVHSLICRIDNFVSHNIVEYGISIQSYPNLLANINHRAGPFNPQFDTLNINSLKVIVSIDDSERLVIDFIDHRFDIFLIWVNLRFNRFVNLLADLLKLLLVISPDQQIDMIRDRTNISKLICQPLSVNKCHIFLEQIHFLKGTFKMFDENVLILHEL